MMDSVTRFGGEVPAALDNHLAEAARHYASKSRAESSLLTAHQMDPQCLPVHFALYKFYFYSGRLADAERVVHGALLAAAAQAGIPADWSTQSPQSADWADTAGPAHFYLFSLKALAFIRLRLGDEEQAVALLDKLAELDPQDSVGADVIRSLTGAIA